ncbi:hypothetical protein ACVVKC_004197 [Salmonella enterica subsp. diarizonae serovar 16:z10:e,n,x,z15]
MSKITLTATMIQSLAAFAAKDGQAAYTLACGHIPAFDEFPGYSGLIAYSVSDDGGVLALEEVNQKDGASSTNFLGAATTGNQSVGYTREELAARARYLAENNPVDILSRKIVDAIKQEIPAEVLGINNFNEAMWVAMQMICGPQGAAMTISRCQIAN